ncbi:hypothetical protein [Winogradskyella sp. SYSU M77433]|uniref:hypothetical protein n=1 Tax=Winogradskyella sp. SYSU M77433 TaxID=3042722 RepID=UPI00247FB9B1|nr:hypothetical protein [Winogradskyella sp. SYSU M77433]MDH7912592.1 hypothetical protein [Winogradskyella sp. SYSU M77433]
MTNRNYHNQNLHDNVINSARRFLNTTDYDIYTNPSSQKNAGIGDLYPDIVMTVKGKTTVKFIIEVETADSINLYEATNQWKKYATNIQASFYILVPLNLKVKADQLCKQVGISVRFGTYSVDYAGNVTNISFN